MSKKKEKDKKDAPIDYQLATKNLQYTVVIKDNDIERLKNQNNNKSKYILSLEDEISKLKKNSINVFDLENKLLKVLSKNEQLEKESEEHNNKLLELQKKHEEEKKRIEKAYKSELNHLKLTLYAYIEKAKVSNQLLIDKEKLEKELDNANIKNKEIMVKNEENIRTLKVRNGIKFTNLKNKMNENLQKTKNKITDLNLQYMDLSSRLTILQNHQLVIQIEYLTQQIDDLKEKIKSYEKQIYDLTKEIEIHKGVEISLAEKNKTLNLEMEKSKFTTTQSNTREKTNNKTTTIFDSNKNSKIIPSMNNNNIITENNFCKEDDKVLDNAIYGKTIPYNNFKNNNKSNFNNSKSVFNSAIFNSNINCNSINTQKSIILKLEKKIFDLEKKIIGIKKEYNDLKDKNDFTEKILQNYKTKYNGLFLFLEECLNNFYNDEELKSNKEIFIKIDSIKSGDFSSLNKEEKYSTLIILMKYLMPLMNTSSLNNNTINNINIKYYEFNNPEKIKSLSNRRYKRIRNNIMNTVNNFYNTSRKINKIIYNETDRNEYVPLPSFRKLCLTENQLLKSHSHSLNKNNMRNKSNK